VWLGVVFCAWFCGLGPSLLATAIMLAGVWYWLIPPYRSFVVTDVRDIFGMLGFLFFAGIIITVGDRARRTRAKLNAAQEHLEEQVTQRTRELAEANERLSELTSNLLHMQDQERRRIARDLHDSIGQILAAIGMNVGALSRQPLPEDALRLITDNNQLIDQVSREIRTISHLLHPPLLEEAGLAAALDLYVTGFSDRSSIPVEIDLAENLPRLSQDLEISVFRLVQECLTNIHKHSGAKNAEVRVAFDNGNVTLTVSDDGRGISPGKAHGVGLTGMHERVRQLDGSLKVSSSSRGTLVTAVLPAAQPRVNVEAS
jgi:signal transduction histidine kinase